MQPRTLPWLVSQHPVGLYAGDLTMLGQVGLLGRSAWVPYHELPLAKRKISNDCFAGYIDLAFSSTVI